MSDWVLCYWIRGQPLDISGIIDVSPQTTVDKLKDRIIQLDNLPSSMNIYKVPDDRPVVDDDSMKDTLGALSISLLGNELRPSRKLSSYFQESVPDSRLHLVIDVPPRIPWVRCWFRGSSPGSSFMVEAAALQYVDELKNAIKAKNTATLADVEVDSLRLYKVSTSATDDELAEILSTNGSGQLLSGREYLERVFSDIPFSDCPGVVIEWFDRKAVKPPPSAYRSIVDGDPIASARAEFISMTPKEDPSSSGTPSSFRTRQGGLQFIPCGRPRNPERDREETIPSTLLHPAFGQFVDDCRSIEVTAEDNWLALDLETAMSDIYSDEAEMLAGVNHVLRRYRASFNIPQIQPTRYMLDEDPSVFGHRYVIIEFGNKAGSSSADPYFEAIINYLESTRESAKKYTQSPLPCLLLLIFGPYIAFAGATWNLRPAIDPLSMPLSFLFHSTDTENRLNVARHMAAFRRAVETLADYYHDLETARRAIPNPPAVQIFPYPTTYSPLQGGEAKKFQYERGVMEKKLIFFATDEDGERICVKFTRTYSEDAHRSLASLGCAPVLRGFDKIAGGWLMVVFDALIDFETLDSRRELLPSSVFDDMTERFAAFHRDGFVHGDIRAVNIMVPKKDAKTFMVIGFDWSGKIGEARYPPLASMSTIRRPADALDGNLITPEHDDFMLDCIRSSKLHV